MNRDIKRAFERIEEAILQHESSINEMLQRYREDVAYKEKDSKRYVDAAGVFNEWNAEQIQNLRGRIKASRKTLNECVLEVIPTLKHELTNQLAVVPSDMFMKQIQLYQAAQLQLSKLEIESMIQMNGTSITGIRALNALLKQTKTPYVVTGKDPDQLSKDLDTLAGLGTKYIYMPLDYHHENCEIWNGVDRNLPQYPGYKFDSVSLISEGQAFHSIEQDLFHGGMKSRWQDIVPSLQQLKDEDLYKDSAEQTKEEQYNEDRQQAVDSSKVEEDLSAAALYRAEQRKAESKTYNEAMAHYAGKK